MVQGLISSQLDGHTDLLQEPKNHSSIEVVHLNSMLSTASADQFIPRTGYEIKQLLFGSGLNQ